MQIPFVGIPIAWGAIGSTIMMVLVYPIVAGFAVGLFFWIVNVVRRFFGLRDAGSWRDRRDMEHSVVSGASMSRFNSGISNSANYSQTITDTESNSWGRHANW